MINFLIKYITAIIIVNLKKSINKKQNSTKNNQLNLLKFLRAIIQTLKITL